MPDRSTQRKFKPRPWLKVHRMMMQAILQSDRTSDNTREMIESFMENKSPTNNMKSVVCQVFAETFHRPGKNYTIRAWEQRVPDDGEVVKPKAKAAKRKPKKKVGEEDASVFDELDEEDEDEEEGYFDDDE